MSKELQAALAKLVLLVTALLEKEMGKNDGDTDTDEEDTKSKKGAKNKLEVENEDDSDDGDDDAAEGDDTDDGDDQDGEEDVEDEDSDSPTREDVIDTLKKYVGKNKKGEREKAVALLKKKFGTGNVNKLNEKHFAAAIKLFKK